MNTDVNFRNLKLYDGKARQRTSNKKSKLHDKRDVLHMFWWNLILLLISGNVSATLSGSIFYGNALLSLMISWKFVKSWKSSTSYWIRIESRASFLLPNSSIRRKVNFVSLFVAISATGETKKTLFSKSLIYILFDLNVSILFTHMMWWY